MDYTLRIKGRDYNGIHYEGYDTAQICENGHLITRWAETELEYRRDFCSDCGAKTLMACLECNAKLLGHLHDCLPSIHQPSAPKFCYACGKPYPWTQKGLEAARELIAEASGLTSEEKQNLNKSLIDLVNDTPGTQVAIIRVKKYLPRLGREIADGLRSIIVEIASNAVKQSLGL